MTTSQCIKNIRLQIGRNQTEFAKLIGKDKTSVSLYESGKRLPSFPTIRNIVELAHSNGIDIKYTDLIND
jgi:transcriptional regulator with XRE-family HTH domain